MLRTLLLCVIASICLAVEPTPAPQTVPELLGVTPVRYSAEDILKHIRVMNPGAEVLIYVIDDPAMFNWFYDLPAEHAGSILGVFRSRPMVAPDIAILGKWSREVGVGLHEFVHYLEYMIPEKREEIRSAFHKLLTPEFRIGAFDLEGPAEPNAELIESNQEPALAKE